MRRFLLSLPALLFPLLTRAQQPDYTAFTVHDGLPSNNVYCSIEDKHGFLWVATDAGVARFDGRRFQVFTTRQGLPDDDVLQVTCDGDGRVWVNCFKQQPAYFDEVRNRFVNAREDTELARVHEGTKLMTLHPLLDGSVLYRSEEGGYIFRHGKLSAYPNLSARIGTVIALNADGSAVRYGIHSERVGTKYRITHVLYHTMGNRIVDSLVFKKLVSPVSSGVLRSFSNGKEFYLLSTEGRTGERYKEFRTNPLRFKVDSVRLPERFFNAGLEEHSFYIVSASGAVYVYDRYTLRMVQKMQPAYLTNSIYSSRGGNLWINTYGSGLLLYRKQHFAYSTRPAGLRQSTFMSIARTPGGSVLAGNAYGQVAELKGSRSSLHQVKGFSEEHRIRKIIVSRGKVFTFSEKGISANFTRNLTSYQSPGWLPAKTAVAYNDSTIVYSLVSGLMCINTRTEQSETVYLKSKRATSLARGPGSSIYFGSTDGLYKCDYRTKTGTDLNKTHPLLAARVTGIAASPDGFLWVTTAGEGLVALRNDRVVLNLTQKNGLLSNSPQCVLHVGGNRVWLGGANGISRVAYQETDKGLTCSVTNLTLSDGLPDNSINEMLFDHDTVFAATGRGVAAIPAGIRVPTFNIPVKAVKVSVNQRDTIISSRYELRHDQQFIQLQFAAIELNGHFRNLQYRLDKRADWTDLPENALAVQLGSGSHELQVRAVDVNGNLGRTVLRIDFDIATPFWRSVWFWILMAAWVQIVLVFVISREQRKRKERKLAKELAGVQIASLEQQAFTSLLNPHFMFNALNSIQHYMNMQDRKQTNRYLSDFASLIRKNFEAAQQSFISLEEELENIRIYLRLEQMRFSGRFSYAVNIGEEIDPDDWMIPTMLLQPLLENALLHGIMPSTIAGEVRIDAKAVGSDLLITITDNGIGITNSQALKQPGRHKSRGMELIRKRIVALSHFGDKAISMESAPVNDDERNPGNRITLWIPGRLYAAWLKVQKGD